MKKFVTLLWMAAVIGCLTVIAHADVIFGPIGFVFGVISYAYQIWPWILVTVVVIITLMMLRKYRKK